MSPLSDDAVMFAMEAEHARLTAAIERVRALHVCSLFLCRDCKAAWPCPTIAALEVRVAEHENAARENCLHHHRTADYNLNDEPIWICDDCGAGVGP